MNLPWAIQDLRDDWYLRGDWPWGIADRWGVLIARFDNEDTARAVISAMNARIALGGNVSGESNT